jgi:hypothetical protein
MHFIYVAVQFISFLFHKVLTADEASPYVNRSKSKDQASFFEHTLLSSVHLSVACVY